jgi:hypothetical protein
LALGLKRVLRELHGEEDLEAARKRWEAHGYTCVIGQAVREGNSLHSMVVDIDPKDTQYTTRYLKDHPVIERLLQLGGNVAERLLLDPQSPIYRSLCERWGAEQIPPPLPSRPDADNYRIRRALYVANSQQEAEDARSLDRMSSEDTANEDTKTLGLLLGYPSCCVDAYSQHERRWPNRIPLLGAYQNSDYFDPLLNNVSLSRLAWIPWVPCRFDCSQSLEIAQKVRQNVASSQPEIIPKVDALLALPRVWLSDGQQGVLLGARKSADRELEFERLVPLDDLWPLDQLPRAGWSDEHQSLRRSRRVELHDDGGIFYADAEALQFEEKPLVFPFGMSRY